MKSSMEFFHILYRLYNPLSLVQSITGPFVNPASVAAMMWKYMEKVRNVCGIWKSHDPYGNSRDISGIRQATL